MSLITACVFLLSITIASAQSKHFSFLVRDGYARSGDVRLYYKILGSGPPVILVHGGPGLSHHYFLPYVEDLAETNTVVLFDQRAHGLSGIPGDSGTMRMKNFVEDIEALRNALGLGKIDLLGHSWGVIVALHYALRYPGEVQSLILVSPAGASSADRTTAMRMHNARVTIEDSIAQSAIRQSASFQQRSPGALDRYFRSVFRSTLADPRYADSLFFYFPGDYAKKGAMLQYLAHDFRDFDLYDTLRSVTIPTLMIHGDSDPTPLSIVEKMEASLPQGHVVRLKGSGHFPFMEQRSRFTSIVTRFLRSGR